MLRIYKPGPIRLLYLILGNIVISYSAIKLYEYIIKSAYGVLAHSNAVLDYPTFLQVVFVFIVIQTSSLFIWLIMSMNERDDEKERRASEKELIRKAELESLRQQFQPHFLFNSLNSIQSLIQFDQNKASEMIQTLADFLRGSISNNENNKRSLEEEIHHLRLYLAIETIRFEDRLEVEFNISEHALKIELPSFIIQPLVENSIKHGLYGTTGSIKIKLRAIVNKDFLIVKVQNPYEEEIAVKKTGAGFGLRSISRRLQLIYFRNDLLKIKKEENLFIAELHIPIR
jgi:LytS/YehU family sensor histidine kinase